MELASVLVNLGGDAGNQIQKSDVTPSEVHILQLLHGMDAVTEIQVTGSEKRTSKAERDRLMDIYAKVQPDGTRRSPVIDSLFPGVAARLYEKFDELELDEALFKAERVSTRAKTSEAPAADVDEGYEAMSVTQLKEHAKANNIDLAGATKKADIIAAIELADEQAKGDDAEDPDGIQDMPDANSNLFQ